MELNKEMFSDEEFLTKKEKYIIAKSFERFVKSGFSYDKFTKRLYEHLHLHCGFIAHYDINGFYNTYFNNNYDLQQFVRHFIDDDGSYNGYNCDRDINKIMADILLENGYK